MRWGRRGSSRRTPGLRTSRLGAAERATVWQCASLLMDYPAPEQPLAAIREAVEELPEQIAVPLNRFLDHRESADLVDLQAAYVETFDNRRRCNLFLTYFVHGDTRKRGMALLRFKQAYQAAGLELTETELPDHLCVVLEFAASPDRAVGDIGRQLMIDHRAGLEMLRMALRDQASPWADVMEAVSATLPALRGDEADAVRRLAAQGPPAEEVGLTPYGTPAFDASLSSLAEGAQPLVEESALAWTSPLVEEGALAWTSPLVEEGALAPVSKPRPVDLPMPTLRRSSVEMVGFETDGFETLRDGAGAPPQDGAVAAQPPQPAEAQPPQPATAQPAQPPRPAAVQPAQEARLGTKGA